MKRILEKSDKSHGTLSPDMENCTYFPQNVTFVPWKREIENILFDKKICTGKYQPVCIRDVSFQILILFQTFSPL